MGLIGDGKKRKSWQRLSFGRQQTKSGALEQERATSRRILRVSFLIFHVFFLTALIAADRLFALPAREAIDRALGLLGMVVIIHVVMFLLVRTFHREILVPGPRFRQYFLLIALALGAARLLLYQDWSPATLVPFPVLAMTLALIYSGRVAVHTMGAVLILFGLMVWTDAQHAAGAVSGLPVTSGTDLTTLVVAQFVGSLVAILGVHRIRTRTRIVTIGLVSGIAQFVTILVLQADRLTSYELLRDFVEIGDPGLGLLNGVISGILVTSMLPYIERIFDVTTDMRLIELADANRPLLKDFALLAPGSFQHSLMVGQLAEEAAGSIGANSLLARVGAYYHDIGKMMKPLYFVENMQAGENIHDRLSPEMSRLIVIAHVKDGIRIALEEKLPRPIVDMIPMHHGTSVVEFFYNKKMRQSERKEEPANEEQRERTRDAFRYPGPKPTFREAGILMLADSVEASARLLSEPTPTRIRQHVRKMIHLRMEQGELDECELTMRDLGRIEDAFVRVLVAIHHVRIRYPDEIGPDGKPIARPLEPGEAGKGEGARGESGRPGAGGKGANVPPSYPGEPSAGGSGAPSDSSASSSTSSRRDPEEPVTPGPTAKRR